MTIQKKYQKSRVRFSITNQKVPESLLKMSSSKELNLLETAGQDFNVVESMILENPKIILLKDSVSTFFFHNPKKTNNFFLSLCRTIEC